MNLGCYILVRIGFKSMRRSMDWIENLVIILGHTRRDRTGRQPLFVKILMDRDDICAPL